MNRTQPEDGTTEEPRVVMLLIGGGAPWAAGQVDHYEGVASKHQLGGADHGQARLALDDADPIYGDGAGTDRNDGGLAPSPLATCGRASARMEMDHAAWVVGTRSWLHRSGRARDR